MCAIEHYTYEEYCQWEGDWELIRGIPLAMSPAPMINHQAIAGNILFELKKSMRECPDCLVISEADWKINDDTVVRPDVVLLCNEPNNRHITKAPEIIVEVISKSTAKRDEQTKFKLYEEERVKYYTLVYPNDCKAKVYKLIDGKYIKEGDFSLESYSFKESSCKAIVDFQEVFKQFRG
jgi:Uma2 family endonuclease